jgi:hypothetical protein
MLSPVPAAPRGGGFVSITQDWEGEDAFLICGGPSFTAVDPELLRGRRTVVVNSSLYSVPFADILFYADERWEMNNRAAVKAFAGRVISASHGDVHCSYVQFLRRPRPSETPDGLSGDPSKVFLRHTSVRGAINLLCHLGVKRIVTLGLDGGPDSSGRTHHHQPHPWGPVADIWGRQRDELAGTVAPLRMLGVELLNASPGSKIPFWPIVELKDVI